MSFEDVQQVIVENQSVFDGFRPTGGEFATWERVKEIDVVDD